MLNGALDTSWLLEFGVEGFNAKSACGNAVEGVRGMEGPHVCAAMLVRRWWRRERMTGPGFEEGDGEVVGERVDALRFREGAGEAKDIRSGPFRGSIVRRANSSAIKLSRKW
jgi:hypothetical protein